MALSDYGYLLDDEEDPNNPSNVITVDMAGKGQGYDLPAYNSKFSDADLSGMPSYPSSQGAQAPASQRMSEDIPAFDLDGNPTTFREPNHPYNLSSITGQGNAPYTLDDINAGKLPPGMGTYGGPDIQRGDLPPVNTSFNVDDAGKARVKDMLDSGRAGGGMMTIGGQTTAIMNPVAQGQGQMAQGQGAFGAGGAGAPAGGGQAPAPAPDPFAAIDAPVINQHADMARREQQAFAMKLERVKSLIAQYSNQEQQLKNQKEILPKDKELYELDHFVRDYYGHPNDSRTAKRVSDAASTMAHARQIDSSLSEVAQRKAMAESNLKVLTSGPTPPSPQEAARTTGAALKARRAAAQAKAGQTQAQAQAQKDWSDQSAELGRINKDMLPKAQKALAALNNSGTPERKAISDQVRASGIKPDGTDAGDKKYQDAVKAAMKPSQAKDQADIERMTARRDQLAASTKNRPGSTGSKSGAQGAASSVVDDRNQAFGIVKSKKPEWSDAQVNAYLDSKEGQ